MPRQGRINIEGGFYHIIRAGVLEANSYPFLNAEGQGSRWF
jgi:hypothetical protein